MKMLIFLRLCRLNIGHWKAGKERSFSITGSSEKLADSLSFGSQISHQQSVTQTELIIKQILNSSYGR